MTNDSIEIELKPLNTRRGQIKAQLTRFATFLDRLDSSYSISQLISRLEKVKLLWREFDDIQSHIELIDDCEEDNSTRNI